MNKLAAILIFTFFMSLVVAITGLVAGIAVLSIGGGAVFMVSLGVIVWSLSGVR